MGVNGKALAFPIEIVRARHGPDEGRIMFTEQMRAAVMAASRMKLPELSGALWKAFREGLVTEDDAQALAELIQVRKVVPVAPPKPRRVGSRPISSASIMRRRRCAANAWLPPQLAASFTTAEAAALSIIAERIVHAGVCDITIGEIAGRAGCCETVVRNALREARKLGLVTVEARRVRYDRNLPNVVRIVSAEWAAWIKLRARQVQAEQPTGGGCRTAKATQYTYSNKARKPAPSSLKSGKSGKRHTEGSAMPVRTIPIPRR